MQLAFDSDVTLRSRFECKYIIPPTAVPAMREFIQPFMAPDRYAARWEGNRWVQRELPNRLYLVRRVNPNPENPVKSLRLFSTNKHVLPILLGVTVEER